MLERLIFPREVRPIRKLLMLHALAGGGSVVEDTATGNPLTFLTDLARPLKSCLATWQPHQSGSGDPSPENVRPITGMDGVNVVHCGKNIFDKSMEKDNGHYYNDSGSYENSTTSGFFTGYIPVNPSTKYTISGSIRNAIYCYDSSKGWISKIGAEDAPRTFTTPTGCKFIRVQYRIEDLDADTVQIELGETATAYAPYSGTSYSVAFPVVGRNLLDPTLFQTANSSYLNYQTGEVVFWSNAYRTSDYVPIDGGETYTLHAGFKGQSLAGMCFYDSNKGYISGIQMASATDKVYTFTTPSNAEYMRFCDSSDIVPFDEVFIEAGDTPHSYEPYTATVYGGSLDLTTGVLTAEYIGVSTTWGDMAKGTVHPTTGYVVGYKPFDYPIATPGSGGATKDNSFCNVGKFSWNQTDYAVPHFYPGISGGGHRAEVYLPNDTDSSTEVQVVCKLVTPLTWQLTPQQITALIGNNTMWADADELSVTYLKKG